MAVLSTAGVSDRDERDAQAESADGQPGGRGRRQADPVGTVLGLWEIVNNLTRLRPTKRERYRVTIFGSARVEPGTASTTRPDAWRRA